MSSHKMLAGALVATLVIIASLAAASVLCDESNAATDLGTYDPGTDDNMSSTSALYSRISGAAADFRNSGTIYVAEGSIIMITTLNVFPDWYIPYSDPDYKELGITYNEDGEGDYLYGHLNDAGTIEFELNGEDSISFTIVVLPSQEITIDSVGGTEATVGYEYRYDVQTTPSNAEISISGVDWLDVSGHTVSGTPTEAGDYTLTVPAGEIAFIRRAFEMNLALCKAGLDSPKTTYARYLLAENGGRLISRDEQATASLLCNGAIEARVLGLPQPAMSITGSGAHGIIATMPLYAACQVQGYPEEKLLRAAALSYLVCMYIKEYSGKLSAFCGCAIAAGTGMACGLVLLRDGDAGAMARTICNMASSTTGMICDGGNQGCTMKGVVAVDAAYRSVSMAMQGIAIDPIHGINGPTPEQTMRNMGLIASPGMTGTEKTMIDILEHKQKGN